ncbi:hypothetical protein C7E17_24410, partial [Stenotrophomonas maltophilia]
KVFYADNGSAGVEVALKMAFQYSRTAASHGARASSRLENGYHGETLGALAMADIPPVPSASTRRCWPKVFYADNGSAGVEVALKMAFQYSRTAASHGARA